MRSLLGGEPVWRPEPVPELSGPIQRLRVVGSVWNGQELVAGAILLRSARRTRDALRDDRRPAVVRAVLGGFADRMVVAKAQEEAIERALGEDGVVKDDASPALRRIRRELRASHGELIRILERVMGGLESHHRAPDMSVTVRDGRYVIPVRREGVKGVGGIVHGTSGTGGTMFVEPPAAVEYGNRIRELESEEQEEVERILAELTGQHSPASRRTRRVARRAGRAGFAARASALRASSFTARRPTSCPRATDSPFAMGGIRCCSRRAWTSCRSTSRCFPTSARCSCRDRTPAARRCCSRRSASSR